MKLGDYLHKRGETQAAFSLRICVSPQIVCDWVSGRRSPSLRHMISIRDASKGRVGYSDWAAVRKS